MAQGSARFLLEFQVTGDQEVIGKIKEVGRAGTESASELQALQGMEDPFAPIAEGAEGAIEPITGVGEAATQTAVPIEEMGTAAEGAVTPLTEMGGAMDTSISVMDGAGTSAADFSANMDAVGGSADAATGGLTSANTLIGDVGGAADTSASQTSNFGDAVSGLSGSFVAIGGAIGTAIGSYFRLQDAQNRVFRSQNALARASESYRKAEEAIDKILATATSNTANIAAARQTLADAQARLNALTQAGITSGPEYEAALADVQTAQAALATEAARGGVDVGKLTAAMEKAEIAAGKVTTSTNKLNKDLRMQQQAILDNVFSYASLGGSAVQIAQGLGKLKDPLSNVTKLFTNGQKGGLGMATALGKIAGGAYIAYSAIVTLEAGLKLVSGLQDLAAGKSEEAAKKFKAGWDIAKNSITPTGGIMSGISAIAKKLGFDIEGAMDTATESTEENKDSIVHLGNGYSIVNGVVRKTADLQANLTAATDASGEGARRNAQAWANMAAMFERARQQTELQSAALDKLIGPTTTLSGELNVMTGEINKLTAADVQSVAATEERNRAMIIANAGFNNAKVAAIQYQQALTEETKRVVEDTDAKNANTRVNETMTGSTLDIQNAVAGVNEEYSASVRELAAMEGAMSNAETKTKAIATVTNEFTQGLMEEEIELRGTLAALESATNAQQAHTNAMLEGRTEIAEYVQEVANAADKEAAMADQLLKSGAAWSDIPEHMRPTIENLKTFGVEAKAGGEAAFEAAQKASDAWRDMTSTIGGELDSLVDILMKGGEDMEESTDKWLEGIEQQLGRKLSDAEETAAIGTADIMKRVEQSLNEFSWGQVFGKTLEQGSAELADTWDQIGQDWGGEMQTVMQTAADIIRADPSMTDAVSKILQGAGKTAPSFLLDELNKLPSQITPTMEAAGAAGGTAFTQGLTGNAVVDANAIVNNAGLNELPPKGAAIGAETGKGMGISLSQEFAAAGTHIAKVIEGIKSNLANIGTGAGAAGIVIPITADVTQAGQQLNSVMTAAQSLKPIIYVDANIAAAQTKISALTGTSQKPIIIYVDANIQAAQTKVSALQTGINSLKQSNVPPIAVNNATAISQIKVVQTQINNIKQKTPPPIKVNNVTALQQIKAVQTAMNNLKQKTPPKITVNNTQALKQIKAVQTGMNNLKSKSINIHVGLSGPGVAYLQHGYHGVVDKPMLFIAGEAGPERVDVTPGRGAGHGTSNEIINRTVHVGTSGGGGNRPINITVVGELNGKELIRFTRRGIMEEASGAM